ncbi:bone morphogenetic protein 7-like [Tachyglossus aculeatus]|uniref:bone morphogenetic protein 7-like n=1 Tax=Tachyglossus aculeatus TaxID=9261 RepID=UPI0018F64D49|nr:bone morphogenetic protein 7-like [Tachyglossus aculeatus]
MPLPLQGGDLGDQNDLEEALQLDDPHQSTGSHREPPRFMMDLYNRVTSTTTKMPRPQKWNMVRSFEEKGHRNQSYFYFNISLVGKDELVIKAELQVFKRRKAPPHPKGSQETHYCKMEVYELLGSTKNAQKGDLITSKELVLNSEGWLVFEVTGTVNQWIQEGWYDRGFVILTTIARKNSIRRHLVGMHRRKKDNDKRNSLLVLFTNTEENTLRHGYPDLSTALESIDFGQLDFEKIAKRNHTRRIRSISNNNGPTLQICQKILYYVNFEDLGWSDWLISPKGFQTNYCKGKCYFPLANGPKITNHATLQSFLVRMGLRLDHEFPHPCCVPDKLSPINLLYYDDDNNVVLKVFQDMVADRCGCL